MCGMETWTHLMTQTGLGTVLVLIMLITVITAMIFTPFYRCKQCGAKLKQNPGTRRYTLALDNTPCELAYTGEHTPTLR